MSWGRLSVVSTKDLREHDRVVELGVAGGVDERERPFAGAATELLELVALLVALRFGAPSELGEARAGSCPNQRRSSVLGASSRAHSSSRARSRATPRGQSRSIRTRYPSSAAGSS